MEKNVLLIEDDQLLAEVYQKSLASEGLNVFMADDTQTAMKLFDKNQIGIIVLDIVLGDTNGFELLKRLRRRAGSHIIPVVIVTGLNTDEVGLNKELCVSLNIIGIYTKSQFSVGKLVEVVQYGLSNYE